MATKQTAGLKIGLTNKIELLVSEECTAEKIGSGLLPVFATPSMLALMENTCAECVQPFLNKGEGTVGVFAQINHSSATPVGFLVTCDCVLTQIDRRRLVFEVRCFDESGLIGDGRHERFIIDNQRFMEKVQEKKLAKENSPKS